MKIFTKKFKKVLTKKFSQKSSQKSTYTKKFKNFMDMRSWYMSPFQIWVSWRFSWGFKVYWIESQEKRKWNGKLFLWQAKYCKFSFISLIFHLGHRRAADGRKNYNLFPHTRDIALVLQKNFRWRVRGAFPVSWWNKELEMRSSILEKRKTGNKITNGYEQQ